MSAHNHTDFILPGDRNPLAILQAIGAILLTLDMVYNRRRLEAMVYALRNVHLVSLVADRHDLVVVPQMVIYHTNDPNESLSSSVSTQPEQDARSVIPDFCILHLPICERNPTPGAPFNDPTSILDWRRFQLESAFIPIIEEDKRPISRAELPMATIRAELTHNLLQGCRDADKSARFLWLDPRRAKQKRVILISSVGLWWRFKLAERPSGQRPGALEEDSDSSGPSDSSESWQGDGDDDLAFLAPPPTDTFSMDELTSDRSLKRKAADIMSPPDNHHPGKRPRTVPPNRGAEGTNVPNVPKFRSTDIIDVDPAPDAENDPKFKQIQEVVVNNIQDAWPPIGGWSGLIHMGTPASSQRLWLIHDWLQTFSTDPECIDLE